MSVTQLWGISKLRTIWSLNAPTLTLETQVPGLDLSLTCCVTFCRSLSFSGPWFPQHEKGWME